MARPDKKRIDTSERPQKPLQNAFSALDSLIDPSKLVPSPEPVRRPAPQRQAQPVPVLAPASPKKKEPAVPPNSMGRVVLRRETKDRGGKTVVIVSGFRDLPAFNAVMVGDLSRKLRNKLGCGGSFDRHEIMLQGDRPAEVTHVLRDMGFRVDGVTSAV
jgi:translation initiation factor 1 (eIF-1/SUI1)